MPRARAKPRRRRAKQERALQTIEVVLDGAARVLQRHGYAEANTNQIAATAGVSVGTIYQYFADKDQIFDAVIRREIERILGVLEEIVLDRSESLADVLRHLLRLLVQTRPDAPVLYRSLEQVPNALFRRRVAEARGQVIAWVRGLLASHQRDIRVSDLDVAAFVLVAAAEGVALNASPELYRTRVADELATVFIRYLMEAGG